MIETPENRLKRLRLRSWRRGMKEMDLLFGRFADSQLVALSLDELDQYEQLMAESDQELYQWLTGQTKFPEVHCEIIEKIRDFHKIRTN